MDKPCAGLNGLKHTFTSRTTLEFLSKVHLSCFLLSCLVAWGVELFQLVRGRSALSRGILITFVMAGLVALTAYLATRSLKSGLPPLVGSSHDWLLVLAWIGGMIYGLTLLTQQKLPVGLFLLPILVALIGMATLVDTETPGAARQLAAHRWGMLHASTLVIGMGTVAAATISALMYLLQYQKLRGRNSVFHRLYLPSLETLTTVNKWLVAATVTMLTVGLATGFILAVISKQNETATFHWSDPTVSGTIVVWLLLVFAVCRVLMQKETSGRQIAQLTFFAGGFLLFTIFGLVLLSGGVHGGGVQTGAERQSSYMLITGGGRLG